MNTIENFLIEIQIENSIYVKNITDNTTTKDLKNLFMNYGPISDCKIYF
jgi:RNA recognition motif-containing protein